GAVIVKKLLDIKIRPICGRLTLAFANVEAYLQFDPDNPDASRYVDQDLNRVWSPITLDNQKENSSELSRARAMRPVIDTVDLLLDLHSMHEKSAPLIVSGPLEKSIALARNLGTPTTIISDEGHSDGCRLRDYADFGDAVSQKNALLIECGQHWESNSIHVAQDSTARFLIQAGMQNSDGLLSSWLSRQSTPSRLIRVTHAVIATSMDFRFAGPYTGLEMFHEAGSVIGWNNGQEIVTPYPDCVLVMPSIRQLRPGVTVVRLGQIV
ncbi:MAG: succinylglutamate desuccinylase/aspartoacylase family protein, partial [Proteobacteria bacterium]|nr:succinylglutamate desuccinylase/aspartoacylase family protein [Pseudomonadota bacterium]